MVGSSGFSGQGGTSAGCGIPATAVAVQLSTLVVSPSRAGGLKVWPAGGTEPVAKFFQYPHATSSGSGVAQVRGTGTSFTVKNYTSSTDLVLDVTGYYLPRIAGMISPSESVFSGTGIVPTQVTSSGTYRVTVDRNVAYCTPMVNAYNAGPGVHGSAFNFDRNTVTAYTCYLDTTGQRFMASFYVYLTVDC